jgi:hypothetical protein
VVATWSVIDCPEVLDDEIWVGLRRGQRLVPQQVRMDETRRQLLAHVRPDEHPAPPSDERIRLRVVVRLHEKLVFDELRLLPVRANDCCQRSRRAAFAQRRHFRHPGGDGFVDVKRKRTEHVLFF